jgi:hypothetical protein
MGKVDPFRAFGLGQSASKEEIALAAARLRRRYEITSADSSEFCEVLEALQAQVTRIVRKLSEQLRAEDEATVLVGDPLLERGCEILQTRGPTAALGMLERAFRAHPKSGVHAAWYGWALFLAPVRPVQERAFLSLEFLRAAQELGGGPAELPKMIARVERALCDPETAACQSIRLDGDQKDPLSDLAMVAQE